jgi:hypothetical protein
MICVVIAVQGDEARLGPAMAALVPAVVDGLVKQVRLVDDGANQGVRLLADDMGADLAGPDMKAACDGARGEWLMILPQPLRLQRGWEADVEALLAKGPGWARLSVRAESWLFARRNLRREGLLVERALYDAVGGWGDRPGAEGAQALLRALRRRSGRGASRLAVLAR